jgi:hypothetical protein
MTRLKTLTALLTLALVLSACAAPRRHGGLATATAVPQRGDSPVESVTTAATDAPAPLTPLPPVTPTVLPISVTPEPPLAEPFPPIDEIPVDQAEVIEDWDMTEGRQGWRPTHDLASFASEEDGIHTKATGGDPYMFGPSISIEAQDAPYLQVRMRSTKGKHAQVFWEVDGRPFNETDSYHFDVEDDGAWHTYLLPLKESAAWSGQITRMRLDPSNAEAGDITIASIRLFGPLPGRLALDSLGASAGIVPEGETFQIQAIVRNVGDQPIAPSKLSLECGAELRVVSSANAVPSLDTNDTYTLTWEATADPGPHLFAIKHDAQWLGRSEIVCESRDEGHLLTLENEGLRLVLPQQPYGYGTGTVYWQQGDEWLSAGRLRSAGRLIYVDDAGNKRLALLYAQAYATDDDRITLVAEHTDMDGRVWTLTTSFVSVPDRPWLSVESVLRTSAPGKLLAWSGPDYVPGEGSFGTAKESGLFPGLEFLLGDELSSGTDFFDASVADRFVPHPNKVTIPLMSITHKGLVTGLMWDPLQEWAPGHERPAALYAVPNRWDHQPNHLMRLFAPGATAGLDENAESLAEPFAIGPTDEQRLSYQLFAAPATDELAALRIWLGEHGVADLPPQPFSYERSIELALEAYVDTTWEPGDGGWHLALHDPWGPGADNVAALHLWWSTLSGAAPGNDAAEARRIAAEGTGGATRHGGPSPSRYLPTLAMHMASSPAGLILGKELAYHNLVAQTSDGGFVFTPNPSEARPFGRLGDTSTGHTAMHTFPLLLGARLYGDRSLATVGMRALDYLQAQPYRPEGAQTWELQLHVPDLLGAAWCVESYVEAYRLTADESYLEEAQRWALAGMPFIYQWSASDRDLMAYGTIPVFGATRYSWPWTGRPVQWNGLAYAIALMDLTEVLDEANLKPDLHWAQVAEGIVIATMQMQATEGKYLGMYPDAWDVVIGDEAYSWWLIPSWHMQALLRVKGTPYTEPVTEIIEDGGNSIHVSTVGELQEVSLEDDVLRVRLSYPAGEDTALLVSNILLPERVMVDGVDAPRTARWEPREPAWDWQRRAVPVRIPMETSTAEVEIVLHR